MRRQAKTTAAAAAPNAGSTVKLGPQAGRTNARAVAESVVTGTLANSVLTKRFTTVLSDELFDLTECMNVIVATVGEVQAGDLRAGEALLTGQAVALNAIFTELARRSALNMGEHLGAAESYMRLALKAQNQCRATVETLNAMKNPPVVFARQANINNGGQQQVNNGAQAPVAGSPAHAHASNSATGPSRLLEASDGERLDSGATATAGGTHQDMDALGVLNRPPN